ncbi:hypothetical protein HPB50_003589 [Hyalomma asiaticum]|uniref:Uncharacterized protein n=1 Tax=Hyalomma asiaticum TaxID=266040 RepID=A0ACB7SUW0_HYAAI|nr:hypothetical protein HPB50_003589 [Hyalomma asiaticum]
MDGAYKGLSAAPDSSVEPVLSLLDGGRITGTRELVSATTATRGPPRTTVQRELEPREHSSRDRGVDAFRLRSRRTCRGRSLGSERLQERTLSEAAQGWESAPTAPTGLSRAARRGRGESRVPPGSAPRLRAAVAPGQSV